MLKHTDLSGKTEGKCLCLLGSIQYLGSTVNRYKHRRTEHRVVKFRGCCAKDNKLKAGSEFYNTLSMYIGPFITF